MQCNYPLGASGVSTIILSRQAKNIRTKARKVQQPVFSESHSKPETTPHVKALNAIAQKFSQVQKTLACLKTSTEINISSNKKDTVAINTENEKAADSTLENHQNGNISQVINNIPAYSTTQKMKEVAKVESHFTAVNNASVQKTILAPLASPHLQPFAPLLNPSLVVIPEIFAHWKNVDALCWLHVVLVLLVHCQKLAKAFQMMNEQQKLCSILWKAKMTFLQVQQLFRQSINLNNISKANTEQWLGQIKTGGGFSPKVELDSKELFHEAKPQISEKEHNASQKTKQVKECQNVIQVPKEAKKSLDECRDAVWNFLQPTLKCVRGRNDSPVFALPVLVQENDIVRSMFETSYCWHMKCTKCGYQHLDRCVFK